MNERRKEKEKKELRKEGRKEQREGGREERKRQEGKEGVWKEDIPICSIWFRNQFNIVKHFTTILPRKG